MTPCMRYTLIVVAIIVALLSAVVFQVVNISGMLRNSKEHGKEGCFLVAHGIHGTEDIVVDYDTNWAYTGDDPRDFMKFGKSNMTDEERIKLVPNRAFYAFNLNNWDPKPIKVDLVGFKGEYLHPHGEGFYHDHKNSKKYFYGINHRPEGDSIEIFEVAEITKFMWLRTLTHPLLKYLDDVYAYLPNEVYATTWHNYNRGTLMDSIETYLFMPWGYITRCVIDGDLSTAPFKCDVAADGLKAPNGISGWKEEVAIVEPFNLGLKIYERTPFGQKMKYLHNYPTHSGCDNVDTDVNGNYFMGCHLKSFQFVAHANNHSVPSPAQCLAVYRDTGKLVEEFYSNGEDFPAASTCLHYKDKLVFGTVYVEGVHVCPYKRSN